MSLPHYNTEHDPNTDTIEYLPLVDWLAFTVAVDGDAVALCGEANYWLDALGGGTVRERGIHGYSHAYSCLGGHGVIAWRPDRPDMGVHVQLPSSALALLPDAPLACEFIAFVLDAGGRFSRVDVAQDTSLVSIDDVRAALWSDELVTKARALRAVEGYARTGESGAFDSAGATYYVGSRSSDRIARFYDKAAEQEQTDRTWVRVEVEHKGKAAQIAAEHLAAGGSVSDLIVSVVDFRQMDSSKIELRSRSSWWESWVGIGARVSFARQKIQKTVEDALAWVENAVAPTLAMLEIAGADLKYLMYRITDRGFGRLSAARRQMAIEYRDSGYSLVPDVPEDLRDVYRDFNQWVINRAFQHSELQGV